MSEWRKDRTQVVLDIRLDGIRHAVREQILVHAEELADKIDAAVTNALATFDFRASVEAAVHQGMESLVREVAMDTMRQWDTRRMVVEAVLKHAKDAGPR